MQVASLLFSFSSFLSLHFIIIYTILIVCLVSLISFTCSFGLLLCTEYSNSKL